MKFLKWIPCLTIGVTLLFTEFVIIFVPPIWARWTMFITEHPDLHWWFTGTSGVAFFLIAKGIEIKGKESRGNKSRLSILERRLIDTNRVLKRLFLEFKDSETEESQQQKDFKVLSQELVEVIERIAALEGQFSSLNPNILVNVLLDLHRQCEIVFPALKHQISEAGVKQYKDSSSRTVSNAEVLKAMYSD